MQVQDYFTKGPSLFIVVQSSQTIFDVLVARVLSTYVFPYVR